jgi:hypothetical protein
VNGELLFPVQSAPCRAFYAGYLPEGRQALVACSYYSGDMIIAVFDASGDLKEVVHDQLPQPRQLHAACYLSAVYEDDYHQYFRDSLGLSPGLIRIKAFHMPAELFGVYHLPPRYRDFLKNPADPQFDEEERQVFPGYIEQWIEQGNFVLEWGNDYWLDATGEVVAS